VIERIKTESTHSKLLDPLAIDFLKWFSYALHRASPPSITWL